jgi:hypothetical protein
MSETVPAEVPEHVLERSCLLPRASAPIANMCQEYSAVRSKSQHVAIEFERTIQGVY